MMLLQTSAARTRLFGDGLRCGRHSVSRPTRQSCSGGVRPRDSTLVPLLGNALWDSSEGMLEAGSGQESTVSALLMRRRPASQRLDRPADQQQQRPPIIWPPYLEQEVSDRG